MSGLQSSVDFRISQLELQVKGLMTLITALATKQQAFEPVLMQLKRDVMHASDPRNWSGNEGNGVRY